MKTVQIMVDDGRVMVGELQGMGDDGMVMAGETAGMETVPSLDEALERARALLTDEETTVERQAESDMDAGYNRVRNVEGY